MNGEEESMKSHGGERGGGGKEEKYAMKGGEKGEHMQKEILRRGLWDKMMTALTVRLSLSSCIMRVLSL